MNQNFTYHTNRQLSDLFGAWLLADSLAEAAGYENERLNSLSELRYEEYDKAQRAHATQPLDDYEADYTDTIASFLDGTR